MLYRSIHRYCDGTQEDDWGAWGAELLLYAGTDHHCRTVRMRRQTRSMFSSPSLDNAGSVYILRVGLECSDNGALVADVADPVSIVLLLFCTSPGTGVASRAWIVSPLGLVAPALDSVASGAGGLFYVRGDHWWDVNIKG